MIKTTPAIHFKLVFCLLFLLGLTACNGSSGANGDDPFSNDDDTSVTAALSITLLDESCESSIDNSIEQGTSFCLQATYTENSSPVSGIRVDFTASIGSLDLASRLTDSSGIATVLVSTTDSTLGAAEASASAESITDTAAYEILQASTSEVGTPSISIAIFQNDLSVNRFRAGTSVQVQATLVDANQQPISNEIVTFTAERGSLATDTGLTDSSGVAEITLTAATSDLGAAIATAQATLDEGTFTESINYEILAADALDEGFARIGHFNDDAEFVEGILGISGRTESESVQISAGATLGVSLAIIDENDQRITTPTPVTFSSNCVSNGLGTIDEQVLTINGEAFSTYEDDSCSGGTGNTDQIVASVVINNAEETLSRAIEILPEDIGSIQFLSATPENIVLVGTGGQGEESISTLTFQVNGVLGNPLSQKQVNFTSNTDVGGLSIDPLSGLTNSQGQVSTRVTAGTVPTVVRVTATTISESGQEISTQSDLLSVNTGLPDQNSFSLSTSTINPEAFNINEVEETITVRLSDAFNNPVPDGTTVNFTTEGGQIEPNCTTVNGGCSVIWRSADPKPSNHRITILATAIGHETFFDTNGNNTFDSGTDGSAISDGNDDGRFISDYQSSGFVDMSEAWRDDNENRAYDSGEIFIDYDNDGVFNVADLLFNGPQCSGDDCGTGIYTTINTRRSLIMVMSSSEAYWYVYHNGTDITLIATNDPDESIPTAPTMSSGDLLSLVFTDTAGQVMPFGTQVGSLDQNGNLTDPFFNVGNTNSFSSSYSGRAGHVVTNFGTVSGDSNQQISNVIEAPSGTQTVIGFTIN